jgi:signal transduction histidine kinase
LNLVWLGYGINSNSNGVANEKAVFSSTETTASSIIFTQRETFAYSTKYALWLAGSTTKREVQIARALLTQRLNVIDAGNTTMGSRLEPDFVAALKSSDVLLENSSEGYLPEASANLIKDEVQYLVAEILISSRSMVASYQQELDRQLRDVASKRKNATQLNLNLLLSFLFMSSLLIGLSVKRVIRQLRIDRELIERDALILESARSELNSTKGVIRTLEQLNDSKNDFISTINHELRTPLTSIIGYTSVIKDTLEDNELGKSKSAIDVVEKNAQVLLDLVESILSLSRFDSLEPVEEYMEVDTIEIIEKSIFVLSPQAEQRKIRTNFTYDRELSFSCIGNPNQLSQIFINVISNAIKFSPIGGEVHINVERVTIDNMTIEIMTSVSDQGIGIPAAELDNLFNRFFRASNAVNSQLPGTGLGLAIVSKIVDLHNGHIKVKSTQDIGSTFSISIPAFLSRVDRLILERRGPVLRHAIESIEKASNENLQNVCHDMGGAIGFYNLEEQSQQVDIFSTWLRKNSDANDISISAKKSELLQKLQTTLLEMDGRGRI